MPLNDRSEDTWFRRYVVDDADSSGIVDLLNVVVRDQYGELNFVLASGSEGVVSVDTEAPRMLEATIRSTNGNNATAISGDQVIVELTMSEFVYAAESTCQVSISTHSGIVAVAGAPALLSGEEQHWACTYTIAPSDPDGSLVFRIDSLLDAAGNAAVPTEDVTDGSSVAVDMSAPQGQAIRMASSNPNTGLAKIRQPLYDGGDTIIVTVDASEEIEPPACTLTIDGLATIGAAPQVEHSTGNTWICTYVVVVGDAAGSVGFSIGPLQDMAGNVAAQPITSVTDGSTVRVELLDLAFSSVHTLDDPAQSSVSIKFFLQDEYGNPAAHMNGLAFKATENNRPLLTQYEAVQSQERQSSVSLRLEPRDFGATVFISILVDARLMFGNPDIRASTMRFISSLATGQGEAFVSVSVLSGASDTLLLTGSCASGFCRSTGDQMLSFRTRSGTRWAQESELAATVVNHLEDMLLSWPAYDSASSNVFGGISNTAERLMASVHRCADDGLLIPGHPIDTSLVVLTNLDESTYRVTLQSTLTAMQHLMKTTMVTLVLTEAPAWWPEGSQLVTDMINTRSQFSNVASIHEVANGDNDRVDIVALDNAFGSVAVAVDQRANSWYELTVCPGSRGGDGIALDVTAHDYSGSVQVVFSAEGFSNTCPYRIDGVQVRSLDHARTTQFCSTTACGLHDGAFCGLCETLSDDDDMQILLRPGEATVLPVEMQWCPEQTCGKTITISNVANGGSVSPSSVLIQVHIGVGGQDDVVLSAGTSGSGVTIPSLVGTISMDPSASRYEYMALSLVSQSTNGDVQLRVQSSITSSEGMCSGNLEPATDVDCSAGPGVRQRLISDALTTSVVDAVVEEDCWSSSGEADACEFTAGDESSCTSTSGCIYTAPVTQHDVCCDDTVGMCSGNTDASEDVVCASGYALRPLGTLGDSEHSCCVQEVSGRCAGNSDPAADVACGGGLVRAHGVVFGSDEATCCVSEVTGKCTGNSDPSSDVICVEGFHPKPGAVDEVDASS